MTISLVSAPVLGFDLVRHPRGHAVAGTLLWALNLGPDDLPVFTAELLSSDAQARARAWEQVSAAQIRLGAGMLKGSAIGGETSAAPVGSMAAVIDGLRRSLLVDLDDLAHLIGSDVLAWARPGPGSSGSTVSALPAVDLLVGAVAADWVDGIDEVTRAELADGVEEIRTRLGERPNDIGPCADQVNEVLADLRQLDPTGRARLRAVNNEPAPGPSSWAEAVHEASWAALTTGRIRSAAAAQLQAVQAFRYGGLDATDGVEGIWNLVSGHVHACVVADVLPAQTRESLAAGWHRAFG